MLGAEMAPGNTADEVRTLRERVVQLENELVLQKLNGRRSGEDRFRFLMDSAPVMVRMTGGDGLCQYFNRPWLEFRGRTVEQEHGNGWAEGLHPDDHDLCMETYLKSFSARQPYRLEYRLRRWDGEYRWVEDTGVPRFEEDGTFAGFIGSTMDVSTRKRGIFTPDEEAVRMVFALTEQERQVLVLIAEGKSTKEAAAHLGISYKTADSHRSRILEKLGVHETASLVRYAIRSGLIAP
jgi:PAS domain S-box-containing protein